MVHRKGNRMSITEPFFELSDKYIDPHSVKTIYDIGSGDCKEAVEMSEHFTNAHIYAFEANPACIYDCSKRAVNNDRITLMPICINNYTGLVKFHPINQEKTETTWEDGNPKASSIFVSNGTYKLEKYVQDELEIPCMCMTDVCRTFKIPYPDIVWMDLQGAELAAIQGFRYIVTVASIIHSEVWGKETYTGQSLFPEMKEHLESLGFSCFHPPLPENWVWADADFIRNDLLKNETEDENG